MPGDEDTGRERESVRAGASKEYKELWEALKVLIRTIMEERAARVV